MGSCIGKAYHATRDGIAFSLLFPLLQSQKPSVALSFFFCFKASDSASFYNIFVYYMPTCFSFFRISSQEVKIIFLSFSSKDSAPPMPRLPCGAVPQKVPSFTTVPKPSIFHFLTQAILPEGYLHFLFHVLQAFFKEKKSVFIQHLHHNNSFPVYFLPLLLPTFCLMLLFLAFT